MAPIRVELNPTIKGNCRRAHCRGEKCLPEWGMWKIPGRTSSLLLRFFFFFQEGVFWRERKAQIGSAPFRSLCCLKWNQFPEFFKGDRGHVQPYNSGFSSVPHSFLVWVFVVLMVLTTSYGIIYGSISHSFVLPCLLVVFWLLQSVSLYNTNPVLLSIAVGKLFIATYIAHKRPCILGSVECSCGFVQE